MPRRFNIQMSQYFVGQIIGFGIGATVASSLLYARGTSFEKKITIKQKYQRTKTGDHILMIQDADGNHYRVRNNLWWWQWYSTELWGRLEENTEYQVKGYGLRNGFIGLYPNIVKVRTNKYGVNQYD